MNQRETIQTLNPAESLADFALDFSLERVPAEVAHRTKLCLLDACGIGLASVNFDFAKKTAAGIHTIAGDGDFPVIGMAMRLP